MHYLTRLAYNKSEWDHPTGSAKEARQSYNQEHGFGHEEWLFRWDWLIDGWRYAFIQGVNLSHARLVRAGEPFDLTLFTKLPNKTRRYVATIYEVECLTEERAADAWKIFQQQGWKQQMVEEIQRVGGNPEALGLWPTAKHVLNVRFRHKNVKPFPADSIAAANDPVMKINRYQLREIEKFRAGIEKAAKAAGRTGKRLPQTTPFLRSGTPTRECTPEHARMQTELVAELEAEYGKGKVSWEQDYIDVVVKTAAETILFEIKSDLSPKTVIRNAIGQILEYAYHPVRQLEPSPRLVIVGRAPPSAEDQKYLQRLQDEFQLPLEYRVVTLD